MAGVDESMPMYIILARFVACVISGVKYYDTLKPWWIAAKRKKLMVAPLIKKIHLLQSINLSCYQR
jgi:hypothetical protein